MKATWNGVVIADSDDTVVLDGEHYFPADSVKREYLRVEQPPLEHVEGAGGVPRRCS